MASQYPPFSTSGVVPASGILVLAFRGRGSGLVRATQATVEMAGGAAAVCNLRRNGALVTPMTPTAAAAAQDPPMWLWPGDELTAEWSGAPPGAVGKFNVFYDLGGVAVFDPTANLQRLVIPAGGGAGTSRVDILGGADVPAALTAYYAASPYFTTVGAAILYYDTFGRYYYEVSLGSLAPTGMHARGMVDLSGNVYEYEFDLTDLGSNDRVLTLGGLQTPLGVSYVNIRPTSRLVIGTTATGSTVTAAYDQEAAFPVTSTGSAAYANIAGVPTATLRKEYAHTRVRMFYSAGCYADVANTINVEVAVQINGVDYSVTSMYFNPINTHLKFSDVATASGIPAGLYTCTARWRLLAGAGAGNAVCDGNDRHSFEVEEVA